MMRDGHILYQRDRPSTMMYQYSRIPQHMTLISTQFQKPRRTLVVLLVIRPTRKKPHPPIVPPPLDHLEVGRNRLVLFPEHPRVCIVPVVPPYDKFRRTQYVRRFVMVVDVTEYDPQEVEYWHLALEEESLDDIVIAEQHRCQKRHEIIIQSSLY